MRGVNHAVWSRERIMAYKKFLNGVQNAEYRGKKQNGDYYKNAVPVSKLIARSSVKFSVSGGKLMVSDGDKKKEVLSGEAVEKMVRRLYKNKAIALGKAPSIYHWMSIRYAGFGYKKVESVVKSIPEYQLYQARHLQKKKSRTIIVSRAPGTELECDLMFFSTKYYDPAQNDNNQGLLVVLDRFSGYIAVRPIHKGVNGKSAEVVTRKMENILRSPGFPKAKDVTLFHDGGGEFGAVFRERMEQLGIKDVTISSAAGAPSVGVERAVGILRKLVNQKLSANAAPRKDSQSWWPMVRGLAKSYNDTPMTDARAPSTPNQLKRLSGSGALAVVRKMQKRGAKRLGMAKNSREGPSGAKVQKTLKVLRVGDKVRVALENVRKTGGLKRAYPTQRWSSKVHSVLEVKSRKLGFAVYVVSDLPKRRFEREDVQLVKKRVRQRPDRAAQP